MKTFLSRFETGLELCPRIVLWDCFGADAIDFDWLFRLGQNSSLETVVGDHPNSFDHKKPSYTLCNEQKLGKLLLCKGLITILSRPSRFLSQTQKLEQPSKVSKFLLFQSLA